jgi:phosphoribosylformylglycinamidine cyclo-ligase
MDLPLDYAGADLGAPLGEVLLRPTRIYVRALRALYAADLLRGAAHITGGGLVDNPTRMLPADGKLKLRLHLGSWEIPPVMKLLQRGGNVAEAEMLRTFNCGLGMLVCVPAARVADARRVLEAEGERVFEVGEIAASDAVDAPVEFLPGGPR